MDIEIPIGAMDVRMNTQFKMLMCRERYESSTTTSLRSIRAIDIRPVDWGLALISRCIVPQA